MSFHLCTRVSPREIEGFNIRMQQWQVYVLTGETILLEELNHKIYLICLDRNLKAAGLYNKSELYMVPSVRLIHIFGLMIEIDDYFTFISPNTRVTSYTNDQKGCSTLLGVSFS